MTNIGSKLKIILVNYRYFVSGGPERYMFNIKELLEKQGHIVVPFSIKHNKNEYTDYEKYFVNPIGDGEEIYGHQYKKRLGTIIKAFFRMVYSFEAKKKIKKLIKIEKPDLIYVLHFQNKLSCSVIQGCYESKIPIVQRISDFCHICIDHHFYHKTSGEICEKCLKGSKLNGVLKKCVNNSYIFSAIKFIALQVQDFLKIRNKIDAFIIPSEFTISKYREYGVKKDKIYHIPTFFNSFSIDSEQKTYNDFFLYVGRIDHEKGLLTLIKAFEDTNYKLTIIGFSTNGYDLVLQDYLKGKNHNIEFAGKLDFKEIVPYLNSCLCTICPSVWYDNLPNSVLESYAFKKAVIASNLGSLRDMVVDKQTGLHFPAGDHHSLRSLLNYSLSNKKEMQQMGENAFKKLNSDFSAELHCQKLLGTFYDVIESKKQKPINEK
jgi:glycosyltransferase involved in cell wall biosynthesis